MIIYNQGKGKEIPTEYELNCPKGRKEDSMNNVVLLVVLSFITFLLGIICQVMWHKNNKDVLFIYYCVGSWFLFGAAIWLIILSIFCV